MVKDPQGPDQRNRSAALPRVRPKATWFWLSAERMHKLVTHMQEHGGAVLFSQTQNHLSLSCKVYLGDDYYHFYANNPTELYYGLIDTFEHLAVSEPDWLENLPADEF